MESEDRDFQGLVMEKLETLSRAYALELSNTIVNGFNFVLILLVIVFIFFLVMQVRDNTRLMGMIRPKRGGPRLHSMMEGVGRLAGIYVHYDSVYDGCDDIDEKILDAFRKIIESEREKTSEHIENLRTYIKSCIDSMPPIAGKDYVNALLTHNKIERDENDRWHFINETPSYKEMLLSYDPHDHRVGEEVADTTKEEKKSV